ncbi:MAG: PadR family transcriptional regulator [Oscillospiraceae bacterium]
MRDNAKSGALTEVTFFILLSLYKPNHGYGIMQFVEEKTNGRLTLGAGSLYGAINTLNEKHWIAPYGSDAIRKKEYLITPLGKEIAEAEVKRLREVLAIATQMMEGALSCVKK